MGGGQSRRTFLKMAALSAGAAGVAGLGAGLLGETGMDFEPNNSYWTREKPHPCAPLDGDLDVDVAVIGAGYTGLSAAWHLAQSLPGSDVVVLEARQPGHGASGRHGGMVLPMFSAESFEICSDPTTHGQLYAITVNGMRALERLVNATGVECDLQLDGYIHAILDEEDMDYYRPYVTQARQVGIPLELLDEAEVAEELGSELYAGGVYDPGGGSVHAMKLVNALTTAVKKAGVRIFGDSPVFGVEEGETITVRVGAAGRTVRARSLVLATNAYTTKLGYFASGIVPIHVQTAVTPPLDRKRLSATGWKSRLPFYDSRNALFHLVLTPDNRIVIGGGSAEYFFGNGWRYKGDLPAIARMLQAELVLMYPGLAGLGFDYVWDGMIGVTRDDTPAVGVTGRHRNIYYGLACNGQGVNLAFVFGEVIAALHQKRPHPWLETPYASHTLPYIPPEPLRWIGVQAAMRYYDWQDKE